MVDPGRDRNRRNVNQARDDADWTTGAPFDDPLGVISAAHAQQRRSCRNLQALIDGDRLEQGTIEALITALTLDLPLHYRDEDEDLFPILLKRALPEDGLEPILSQLSSGHATALREAAAVADILRSIATSPTHALSHNDVVRIQDLTATEQRHLAVENGIVMVIARKRLKASDLAAMSQSMAARRRAAN